MVNSEVRISYANDDLLYLPLFYAKYKGYLPDNYQLVHTKGDQETINSIMDPDNPVDFAICDPLADLTKITKSLHGTKIKIIGSLFQKTPVWLYNTSTDIERINHEKELINKHVGKIVCYNKPNTGYYFGERLKKILDADSYPGERLKTCEFGDEFNSINDNDVVVTSNLFHLAQIGFSDRQKIIFNYAQEGSNETSEVFFTGILSREKFYREHIESAIILLKGIKKAINDIYKSKSNFNTDKHKYIRKASPELIQDSISAFKNIYAENYKNEPHKSPFNVKTDPQLAEIFTSVLNDAILSDRLYSNSLGIGVDAWKKSILLRGKKTRDLFFSSSIDFTPVYLSNNEWYKKFKTDWTTKIYNNYLYIDIGRTIGICIMLVIATLASLPGLQSLFQNGIGDNLKSISIPFYLFAITVLWFLLIFELFFRLKTNVSNWTVIFTYLSLTLAVVFFLHYVFAP